MAVQVTAGFADPTATTVALNCWAAPGGSVTVSGSTVTAHTIPVLCATANAPTDELVGSQQDEPQEEARRRTLIG